MTEPNAFLSGAIMATSAMIAVFFLRVWKETTDPLFVRFAAAFALLSTERWFLLFSQSTEASSFIYLFRLVAFALIIWAIVEKNRKTRPMS